LLFYKNFDIIYLSKEERKIIMKNWTYEDQMTLDSDIKDSILAGAAYFDSKPSYEDLEEEFFDEFCDSFFETF